MGITSGGSPGIAGGSSVGSSYTGNGDGSFRVGFGRLFGGGGGNLWDNGQGSQASSFQQHSGQ